MEDREFFDHAYKQWALTTGGESDFWMPEEYTDHSGRWNIYSVDSEDTDKRKLVASSVSGNDADFITGMHGCFGDLIRRLHEALDEADRLDEEKDGLVVTLANREISLDRKDERISELEAELRDANSECNDLQRRVIDLEDGR